MKLDLNEQAAVAEAVERAKASTFTLTWPPLTAIEALDLRHSPRPAEPTIHTLEQFSRQEVFDFVVRKVIKQGVPAMQDDQCVLLDKQGHRCAVGMLVPVTRVGATGLPATSLLGRFAELISGLVTAHDRAARMLNFVGAFRQEASYLARRLGLNNHAARI